MTGAIEPALVNLQKSVELLNQLYLEDRTKLQYRWNFLTKSGRAAHLMSLDGQLDEAWDWYLQIENQGQKLIEDDKEVTLRRTKEYAEFLIHFSETSFRNGEKQKAISLLDEATQRLQTTLKANPKEHEAIALLVLADFNRWFQSGSMSAIDRAIVAPMPDTGPGALHSCNEINLYARQALMSGDLDSAREYSSLLQARGYYDPEFMQLCAKYEICG